jgi:hypothetical protein
MRLLKQFKEYVDLGTIKKVSSDILRAKSLSFESNRKMKCLIERVEKLEITKDNANDYVEYCYDILMHLIRAKLCVDGYSSTGIGAHEAEVSYLRILEFSEKDVLFMDEIRYYRNGILYYGTSLDLEYAIKVVDFTKKKYSVLKEILKL